MADERKVFPVENVLELVTGKSGADVRQITNFVLGRTVDSPEASVAAAPFAAAWLARWYPKFMNMEWKEGENWDAFVKQAAGALGDHVSLSPMSGRMKDLAHQVVDAVQEAKLGLARQMDACAQLEKQIAELRPWEAEAHASRKKIDELENTIKSLKADMAGLNRKAAEFQGKLAIDHETLMENIKDAIKDGLKGLSIGSVVADTMSAAAGADSTAEVKKDVPDDFGFGTSGPDSDGFGF